MEISSEVQLEDKEIRSNIFRRVCQNITASFVRALMRLVTTIAPTVTILHRNDNITIPTYYNGPAEKPQSPKLTILMATSLAT